MLSSSSKSGLKDSSNPSLREEITSLAKGTGALLSARAELMAIEGREAAGTLTKRLIHFAIALAALTFGYLLLLTVSIHFLGDLLSKQITGPLGSWIGAALFIGIIHFTLAVIFLIKARNGAKRSLFELTRSEWHKDQKWLSKTTNRGN